MFFSMGFISYDILPFWVVFFFSASNFVLHCVVDHLSLFCKVKDVKNKIPLCL